MPQYVNTDMNTDGKEYADYLRGKFLPGRTQYLEFLVFPRYLRELPAAQEIWDLGFGNGEFLTFCRKSGIDARGIDSNPHFVASARHRGLEAELDDITKLQRIPDGKIRAALSDNVLEHLDRDALREVFRILAVKLAPGGIFLVAVPGEKGFQCDPTHKTFVDEHLVSALLKDSPLVLKRRFRHPINSPWVSRHFYLNMTVFTIHKPG
jgi:SAM-dependent methyltransferase